MSKSNDPMKNSQTWGLRASGSLVQCPMDLNLDCITRTTVDGEPTISFSIVSSKTHCSDRPVSEFSTLIARDLGSTKVKSIGQAKTDGRKSFYKLEFSEGRDPEDLGHLQEVWFEDSLVRKINTLAGSQGPQTVFGSVVGKTKGKTECDLRLWVQRMAAESRAADAGKFKQLEAARPKNYNKPELGLEEANASRSEAPEAPKSEELNRPEPNSEDLSVGNFELLEAPTTEELNSPELDTSSCDQKSTSISARLGLSRFTQIISRRR